MKKVLNINEKNIFIKKLVMCNKLKLIIKSILNNKF